MSRIGSSPGRFPHRPFVPPIIVLRALLLGLVLLVLAAPSASAARYWCRTDPVFVIDGAIADLFVSVPVESLLQVNGATQIVLEVPVETDVQLVVPGVGFGYGEQVSIEHSRSLRADDGIELRIRVLVPATDSIPVLVEFSPRILGILHPTSREGVANGWIHFKATL